MSEALLEKQAAFAARRKSRPWQNVQPWLMLAPTIIMLIGFVAYPAVNAVYVSMTSTNLLNPKAARFIGIENFVRIFQSQEFLGGLRNSAIWTFGNVAFQLTLGMCGAILLNQKLKGRAIARGLVLLPWATPSVLVALMWLWILDPNLGIFNRILSSIGLQAAPVAWLANPHTALATLMAIDIWQGIPFFAIMILAALQAVPSDILEAARIDGANAWKTYWQITLPLIVPTVLITTILRLIWTANYFDLALVLTGGGPANATLTLPLDAYLTAYRGMDFGSGAALGIIQAGLMLVLVVFYIRRIRKSDLG